MSLHCLLASTAAPHHPSPHSSSWNYICHSESWWFTLVCLYGSMCVSRQVRRTCQNHAKRASLWVWSPTCYCNVAVDVGELLFQQDELRGGRLLPLQLQHYVRVVGHFAAFLFVQGDIAAHYVCETAQKGKKWILFLESWSELNIVHVPFSLLSVMYLKRLRQDKTVDPDIWLHCKKLSPITNAFSVDYTLINCGTNSQQHYFWIISDTFLIERGRSSPIKFVFVFFTNFLPKLVCRFVRNNNYVWVKHRK